MVSQLEALHAIALDIDAYHSAFEELHQRTPWSTDGDPDNRRDRNRMGCLLVATSAHITKLLVEFEVVVGSAIKAG